MKAFKEHVLTLVYRVIENRKAEEVLFIVLFRP